MFSNALSFNQSLDKWDTAKVTDMDGMFYKARKFNGAIGKWDISKVTTLREMVKYAKVFHQPITWNANNVKVMKYMFDGATAFNQDISGWRNTSSSVDADNMLKDTAMSQENYCKVAKAWTFTGNLGLGYTCN